MKNVIRHLSSLIVYCTIAIISGVGIVIHGFNWFSIFMFILGIVMAALNHCCVYVCTRDMK